MLKRYESSDGHARVDLCGEIAEDAFIQARKHKDMHMRVVRAVCTDVRV